MTDHAVSNSEAIEDLAAEAARQRVSERELVRKVYRAASYNGLSQRQISDILQRSQATVQRTLRRVTDDPSLLDETPAEVIDRRTSGMISDDEMMERLLDWRYTFGGVVRIRGVATDAYTTGDWDDIEMAYYRGQLTDEEFQALASRQIAHTMQ